jgi:hypothetical protein
MHALLIHRKLMLISSPFLTFFFDRFDSRSHLNH